MQGTKLPTITKLIEQNGGLDALADRYIRIENPPYMRLVIERIQDFDGMPQISVAHYTEQNGDTMRDPEISFVVSFLADPITGKRTPYYQPVTCQMDFSPVESMRYQQAIFHGDDGRTYCRPNLYKSLTTFARTWDTNIHHQGFVEAQQKAMKGA